MAVVECRVEVVGDAVEGLEEALELQEDSRWMIVEDKPAGRAWVMGYFGSNEEANEAWGRVQASVEPAVIVDGPAVRALADADWRESYKAHFKAWRFGRLHWVPVWERASFVLPPGEAALWLDPGLAFGTGNHETTRLVVERLVAFAEGRGTRGRVIDAGCGSGILALSAATLGFGDVVAFDNDPEAVRISEQNAVLNGLTGRVGFFAGDLAAGLAGRQAELVLANIQADVLVRHARELIGAVAPGGCLILSGILTRECEDVSAEFGAIAPSWIRESRTLGEWADLAISRIS